MSQFSLLNSLQNKNNGNVVRTMRKETNNLCSRKQRNPFLCSTILSSLSLVVPVVILRLHHVYWYHMHPRSNNLQLSRASLKSWSCQFSLREAPFLFFCCFRLSIKPCKSPSRLIIANFYNSINMPLGIALNYHKSASPPDLALTSPAIPNNLSDCFHFYIFPSI